MAVRVLLLADTHLGFDDPTRPRVDRRRRGPDFFAAFERALAPARDGRADLVVHGGDLLHRSRVPAGLVQRALAPLRAVADRGIPVFLVPGNHERSRIPAPLLARHEHLHVFDRPRTFACTRGGLRIALSGFPCVRRIGEGALRGVLESTGWRRQEAEVRLLCMHQAVEGARVGVQDFEFRPGPEVIARREIPAGFAAVLSGHIHRAQVLRRSLAAPVLYPGSVERTSFAERAEVKGCLRLRFAPGRLLDWELAPLPARPMVVLPIDARGHGEAALASRLRASLASCDPEAVVRIDVRGDALPACLRAARLREIAPRSMNVSVRHLDAQRRSRTA